MKKLTDSLAYLRTEILNITKTKSLETIDGALTYLTVRQAEIQNQIDFLKNAHGNLIDEEARISKGEK